MEEYPNEMSLDKLMDGIGVALFFVCIFIGVLALIWCAWRTAQVCGTILVIILAIEGSRVIFGKDE